MRSAAAKRVVIILTQIFSRYGFSFTLKFDNRPKFCSEEFEKFLSDHGIEHLLDISTALATSQWTCRKTEENSA